MVISDPFCPHRQVCAARDLVNHLAEIRVYFGDLFDVVLKFLDRFGQSCIDLPCLLGCNSPSPRVKTILQNDSLQVRLAAISK